MSVRYISLLLQLILILSSLWMSFHSFVSLFTSDFLSLVLIMIGYDGQFSDWIFDLFFSADVNAEACF